MNGNWAWRGNVHGEMCASLPTVHQRVKKLHMLDKGLKKKRIHRYFFQTV